MLCNGGARPGHSVAAPLGADLGFYDGSGGGGALGAIPPLPPQGSGAEPRPKSNLVHFYPHNIPSEDSKLSDVCGIWEHLK